MCGTAAREPGKFADETGAVSGCDTACCVKTQSNTLQEPQHTEREKEGAAVRGSEKDTKDAFTHSGC